MSERSKGIEQAVQEWLSSRYQRDEQFLMVEDDTDLTPACISALGAATNNLCVTQCNEFDGDYHGWAKSIQKTLSRKKQGVLFLAKLNSLPEQVQSTLRAFWLNSMQPTTEQRLAFSFIPVCETTMNVKRFDVARAFFDRRAHGLTIRTPDQEPNNTSEGICQPADGLPKPST